LCDLAQELKKDETKLGAVLSHQWEKGGTANAVEDYENGGYTSYRSGINLFKEPYREKFMPLHEAALEACFNYVAQTPWQNQDNNPPEGLLTHAWVSIYGKDHFVPEHIHTDSHISFVFYGASDEETGHIRFRNPAAQSFRMSHTLAAEMFCEVYAFPPKVGHFIVFPSFMSHYTDQHKGDQDRIIYSGNFVFRRTYLGDGFLNATKLSDS